MMKNNCVQIKYSGVLKEISFYLKKEGINQDCPDILKKYCLIPYAVFSMAIAFMKKSHNITALLLLSFSQSPVHLINYMIPVVELYLNLLLG